MTVSRAGDAPIFPNIAIVGLGLIGGSIALALRERWPSCRVIGVDHASVLAHALGSGAIDRAATTIADIGAQDLIILAAPVRQNVELIPEIPRSLEQSAPTSDDRGGPTGRGGVVITDVGGTKRDIVAAARALPASATFVGGHPIGGAERGGFAFARPDLFAGRPWIFTPDGEGSRAAVPRLFQFVESLGAQPSVMDAAEHDRLMAFLSHLPQLTASALMEVAGSAAAGDGLRLAGRGLMDTTRLASSAPAIWRDICAANADEIGRALTLLIDRLSELRADLQRGEAVETIFAEAARWRAELTKERS